MRANVYRTPEQAELRRRATRYAAVWEREYDDTLRRTDSESSARFAANFAAENDEFHESRRAAARTVPEGKGADRARVVTKPWRRGRGRRRIH